MQMPSLVKTLALAASALAMVACGPPDEASRVQSGPIQGPFVVSDFFTPSGLMGDGQYPGRVSEGINHNCKQPRPPGAQGDCYHFLYTVGDVKWAGAYWVFPSNSWGTVPGRSVVGPVDLGSDGKGGEFRGYTRVRVSMATDPLPNPPFIQIYAGGIDGSTAKPPQPFRDEACLVVKDPAGGPSQSSCDKFQATDGGRPTTEWKQFTIDLSGYALSSVIGAFGFSTNDNDNPGVTQSIYIDDIVWE